MFSGYGKVGGLEEEDVASARLVRDASVADGPVMVTSSQRPSFPNIMSRKAPRNVQASTTATLIEFEDAAQQTAGPRQASSSSRKAPTPHAVELVSLVPTDPFDLLLQSRILEQHASKHTAPSGRDPSDLSDLLGPDNFADGVGGTRQQQQQQQQANDPLQAPVHMSADRHGSLGASSSAPPSTLSGQQQQQQQDAWWTPVFGPFTSSTPANTTTSTSLASSALQQQHQQQQWQQQAAAAAPSYLAQAPHAHASSSSSSSMQHPKQQQDHNQQQQLGRQQQHQHRHSFRRVEGGSTPGGMSSLHANGSSSYGQLRDAAVGGGTSGTSTPGGLFRQGSQVSHGYESDPHPSMSMSAGQQVQVPEAGSGSDSGQLGTVIGPDGKPQQQRLLLLFAIPLVKDKLVFLPVVTWKEEKDVSTVAGKVSAGLSNVSSGISSFWHSLKDKDPGSFAHKVYRAGQGILENMNAEERLMRNIPKGAAKMLIHHPTDYAPDEIQDMLTALTSNFCVKSAGKAAVAGVMLPVAVGLELVAIPGIGWYTAYQLFKSTSAAAGGSRLNQYLKERAEVRINYAPNPMLDPYVLKARLSPDATLGVEDIEDLCHDISQPSLVHPLTELRMRHLKRNEKVKADYALLPMNAPDGDDYSSDAYNQGRGSSSGTGEGGKKDK